MSIGVFFLINRVHVFCCVFFYSSPDIHTVVLGEQNHEVRGLFSLGVLKESRVGLR